MHCGVEIRIGSICGSFLFPETIDVKVSEVLLSIGFIRTHGEKENVFESKLLLLTQKGSHSGGLSDLRIIVLRLNERDHNLSVQVTARAVPLLLVDVKLNLSSLLKSLEALAAPDFFVMH